MKSCPVIVTPKRYVAIRPGDFPIFLLGSALDGEDWEAKLIEEFIAPVGWTITGAKWANDHVKFFVPCRWDASHLLAPHFCTTYEEPHKDGDLLSRQVAWEHHYLHSILSGAGLIVFVLFPGSKKNQRGDEQPGGRDIYGKIGRWTTEARALGKSDQVIVAAHPSFPGFRDIWDELCVSNTEASFRTVYSAEEVAKLIQRRIDFREKKPGVS